MRALSVVWEKRRYWLPGAVLLLAVVLAMALLGGLSDGSPFRYRI